MFVDVHTIQKVEDHPLIYYLSLDRRDIVWRAAQNAFLGELWVRTKISCIFAVNGSCGSCNPAFSCARLVLQGGFDTNKSIHESARFRQLVRVL